MVVAVNMTLVGMVEADSGEVGVVAALHALSRATRTNKFMLRYRNLNISPTLQKFSGRWQLNIMA
jgi:hypothetical protein